MTFKEWPIKCNTICGFKGKLLAWDHDLPIACPTCGEPTLVDGGILWGQSAGVIGDDIPGGIEIKHGLCNPDGTPRRYYSKTEIKRAANEAGYTISGDTCKPYPVQWSGRQEK